MTQFDVCDEILKFVVAKTDKVFDYYNDPRKLKALKVPEQSIYPAMFYLCRTDVGYLQKHLYADNCSLTPSGEDFILAGGYAGERKRNEEEKLKTQTPMIDNSIKVETMIGATIQRSVSGNNLSKTSHVIFHASTQTNAIKKIVITILVTVGCGLVVAYIAYRNGWV